MCDIAAPAIDELVLVPSGQSSLTGQKTFFWAIYLEWTQRVVI